jgi:glucose-6-phosphate 1-dehydrogenase
MKKTSPYARIRIRERLCIESAAEPCGVVMFGASGDLARRKVLPSLFSLFAKQLVSPLFFLVGYGRTALTTEAFRAHVRHSLTAADADATRDTDTVNQFLAACDYVAGDYDDPARFVALRERLETLQRAHATHGNLLAYLSVPPSMYAPIVAQLGRAGLTREHCDGHGWMRVIVEKPFGRDLASARTLDKALRATLTEHQIYRIDHYVAKETVQNICMLRFANTVFEPLWNRNHIDHVQITVGESVGVGERAGYFEQAGVVRDMFQNHILQLVALTAMETPASFSADAVHDAKAAVLRAIRPLQLDGDAPDIVRAQYTAGTLRDQTMLGYREEPGVAPDSCTETYAAVRLDIATERWRGVPFYLRSGKRLMCKKSEIAVVFKHVARSIFEPLTPRDLSANVLVLNIQPDEGLALMIQAKKPGPKLCLCDMTLDVTYREAFQTDPPESYERLLLDAMLGDQTLFTREDLVELGWQLFTPVLDTWRAQPTLPLYDYPAGSWGPTAAERLLERDGNAWRDLCAWCRNRRRHHGEE